MHEKILKSSKNPEQLVSKCLEMPLEEVRLNQRRIDGTNCTYYWNPARGGLQMIMSDTGEMLIATSAISFTELYTAYTAGKRNGEELIRKYSE